MIVVSVHDKVDMLSNLLEQLSNMDVGSHEILVIDTNSTDQNFLLEFPKLIIKYPSIRFERVGYDCWDSGAYVHAYSRYMSGKYIFLHDSISILNKNFITEIDQDLENFDVSAISSFPYSYDNHEQMSWVEQDFNGYTRPTYGFFGPMFAATRSILDKIPRERFMFLPQKKLHQMGMERRWSLIFHSIDAKVAFRSADLNWTHTNRDMQKFFPYRE